jgi:hypothetical protein
VKRTIFRAGVRKIQVFVVACPFDHFVVVDTEGEIHGLDHESFRQAAKWVDAQHDLDLMDREDVSEFLGSLREEE